MMQPQPFQTFTSFATDPLEIAWQQHQAGQHDQAERTFRQFVQANPNHAQAWRLLGLSCLAQNKLADAEASFRKSLGLQPAAVEVHNDLGVTLGKQGDIAQAMASFEDAIRLKPDDAAGHINLTQALFRQGQFDKATSHASEVVRLRPDDPEAHNQMGAVLAQQGRLGQAMGAFEQALRIKPGHTGALINLDRSRFLQQNQLQNTTNQLLGAIYHNQLIAMPRYADPKRLLRYGYKVYSQENADGMIQEIFARIGTTNKRFIEFGTQPHENNTTFLLMSGWGGLWLDARELDLRPVTRHVTSGTLNFAQVLVTEKNINDVIREHYGTGEIDLLSVDISGNDYWVWKALDVVSPRVVVIEYNSSFSPSSAMTGSYIADDQLRVRARVNDFGASLKAYEKLATQKGYRLVGCDLRGVDAFFVRQDLVGDLFCEPFTAENHYEPPRFFTPQLPGHHFAQGEFKEV